MDNIDLPDFKMKKLELNYVCTKCKRRTVREVGMFPNETKCEYCDSLIVPIEKEKTKV